MAPSLAEWSSFFALINVPVYFLVAFILYRRKLWRAYIFFWLYLLVEGAAAVANLSARGANKNLLLIYLVAQPPLWILYVLMVVEVFRKVFARYPGVSRFAQRLILISLLIAFIFSLASIGADVSIGWKTASTLHRYSVIQRTVTSALSLYLILIAGFLVWMPIPLPRNTIRHSFLFFFYFLITTGVHHYANLLTIKDFIPLANLILNLLTLTSLTAWLFLLRTEGEALPNIAQARHSPSPGALLDHLESLNKALTRPNE